MAATEPLTARADDDREDLEQLRQLLFGQELQRLVALRAEVDDPERWAERVAAALADALRLRGEDPELADILEPTVREALSASTSRDPRPLAEALSPALGPAIRRSIRETLAGMLQQLNHTLETRLSPRSLAWRWEAFRTGRPLAEVALLRTLDYRVEQAFLIHRESGLLLQHVNTEQASVQDPSMVSGMLSAITDFSTDAFGSSDQDRLETFQVGDLAVWVRSGPRAHLAATVRGELPREVRVRFQEALETIHLEWGRALADFDGDDTPFETTRPVLRECLLERRRDRAEGRPWRAIAVVGAVGLALAVAGLAWLNQLRLARQVERTLRTAPGYVVLESDARWSGPRIVALQDPLAAPLAELLQDTDVPLERVEVVTQPFLSAEPNLVARRLSESLGAPTTVTVRADGRGVELVGVASTDWIARAREQARWLAAGVPVDLQGLRPVEGDAWAEARQRVQQVEILFGVGSAVPLPDQGQALDEAWSQISVLLAHSEALNRSPELVLVGHTDTTGREATNQTLSRRRAEAVRAQLVERGAPLQALRTIGVGSSMPANEDPQDHQRSRRVTVRVDEPPGGPR